MRLIDADTLCIPPEEMNAKMAVAYAPTIDAVPVVPGKWMPIQKQPYFRKHFENEVSCSVCHKKGHTAWNYCPHCGAKMEVQG